MTGMQTREQSFELRKAHNLPMRPKEIYFEAIRQWGEDLQLNMAVEECSELIHAIQKFRREKSEKRITDLVGEVADVGIMLEQIEEILVLKYGIVAFPERVRTTRSEKLKRLEGMLKKKYEQQSLVEHLPLHN